MRVGWLHANPGGYVGGAELTMAEFKAAAPEGVEVIDCPPDEIADCDVYVIGNPVGYNGRPAGIRYLHDMRGGIIDGDTLVFCSPLQRQRYGLEGRTIPPPIDLNRFKVPPGQKRNGTVAIGAWQNPGKGQLLLREWSHANNELIHVYGDGPFIPTGPNIDYLGALSPKNVAEVLWAHERFIHLPTALEPFGRAVAEAWAAGCDVIANRNVGACYWIEENPAALESAAKDFWRVVTSAEERGG